MKIHILLPDLRAGGVERIRLVLAYEFQRLGFSPEFVLMQHRGQLLAEAMSAFPVHSLRAARVRDAFPRLICHLRKNRPDALLVGMWPLTAIAPFALLLSGHRCPIIVSEHAILSAQYRNRGLKAFAGLKASAIFCYRFASNCVAVSNGVARDISRLAFFPLGKISVINNPCPPRILPGLEQMSLAESLWRSPRGARLLSVGTLKEVKNHSLLLYAFSMLSIQDSELMIVGSGELETSLRQLAGELGIADKVIFAGFQSDPTPFYLSADLFVLSSDYEGFGNVIVEALAQGLPVVSTDCPSGPAEILENGRWGRLVRPGDATALAIAISDSLEDVHDKDALKRRAADFSPEIAAQKYVDLLMK